MNLKFKPNQTVKTILLVAVTAAATAATTCVVTAYQGVIVFEAKPNGVQLKVDGRNGRRLHCLTDPLVMPTDKG